MQSRCGQQENKRENYTTGGNEKEHAETKLQKKTGNNKQKTES